MSLFLLSCQAAEREEDRDEASHVAVPFIATFIQ